MISHPPKQFRLIALFYIIWLMFPTGVFAQDEDEISRLAEGLRSRGLFDLAEFQCLQELKSEELKPKEQATLVLELIRTRTARAAVSSGSERESNWQLAIQTADQFIANHPNHPRRLLVEVQRGLTHLTRGRLLRQELQADIAPSSARDLALDELRAANSIFEELQRKIRQEIPQQRGKTVGPDELSADQLIALNNNLRLQAALTGINRAQLYPVDDKLNRLDALNVVLERSIEVRRETNSDQPIWWQAGLQQVECLRLLQRFAEANKILAELPIDEADDATRQAVAVQQIRLALAVGDETEENNLVNTVLQIKNRSAELDLAVVELMMNLASSGQPGDWRSRASNQLVAIENRHGPYWGRRAEMLVIGDSTSGSGAAGGNTNSGSETEVDLLIRIGDQAVRKNRLDDALKAYTNAAAQAETQQNWQLVFSATIRLSQVLESQHKHRQAFQQLVEVAKKCSNFEHAPAAHLRGCWNLIQSSESNTAAAAEIRKEFLDALEEHLKRWPHSPTANQARLWAGRQLQTQQQWRQASQQYTAVASDSPFFADAVKQSYICIRELMKVSPTSQSLVRDYAQTLQKLATEPNITSRGRAELISARAELGFQYGLEDNDVLAKQLLDTLGSADEDDRLLLSSQLVAALADAGEALEGAPAVDDVLKTIEKNESALQQAVASVNELIGRQQAAASEKLLKTKLQIAEKALALDLSETQRISWMGHRADALQRLGRDDEAVDALTKLAARKPKSAAIQLQLCRALNRLQGEQAAEQALNSWRRLAPKLKPRTESWFEAKYNVAFLLNKTGQSSDALKLLEYLKAIPPGWSNSNWKGDFDRLLIKCQNENRPIEN